MFDEYDVSLTESKRHGALMITGDTNLNLLGQKTLLNEWIVNSQAGRIATRDAMQPAQFISELAHISVLERDTISNLMFRICGSGISRMLGQNARGRHVDDFPELANSQYGIAAMDMAFQYGEPVSGNEILHSERVHFWLRLPLLNSDGNMNQILCHDRIVDFDMLESEAPGFELDRCLRRAA